MTTKTTPATPASAAQVQAGHATQPSPAIITYPAELHPGTDGQPGNAAAYDFSAIKPVPGTPWAGKTLGILGSSVAYGACSLADGPGEYIARRLDMRLAKEAVSGTTLADLDDGSYVHRLDTRLPASLPIDLFICQLSTNDASHGVPLGDAGETDTHTVAGALNHIVATVRGRWDCPLVFFTGARFDSPRYQNMVDLLFDMQRIHGFGIIDLWDDAAWNAIPDDRRALYMHDPVHPTKAGYRDWWGPEMVRQLLDLTR